jgi:hypothetical protein
VPWIAWLSIAAVVSANAASAVRPGTAVPGVRGKEHGHGKDDRAGYPAALSRSPRMTLARIVPVMSTASPPASASATTACWATTAAGRLFSERMPVTVMPGCLLGQPPGMLGFLKRRIGAPRTIGGRIRPPILQRGTFLTC